MSDCRRSYRYAGYRERCMKFPLSQIIVVLPAAVAAVGIAAAAETAAPFPEGKGWPCWRGPDGSGTAAGCGGPLVDDLSEMRLVWRSEERSIPANCWHNETQGGYDSPIVANGKVFISYFKGTGDVLDTSIQGKGISGERLRWCQAVVTDDTVLCADARTGKTLWKRVLGKGINLYQRRKGGPHQPPCWHNGKVFAQSTLARLYCLNDSDGTIVWQADAPATPHLLKVQTAYRKAGKQHPYRGLEPPEFNGVGWPELCMMPLAVAGGVVVADGGGRLAAFDAATGEMLPWETGFATRGRSGLAPLRLVCDRKEYFVVGNTCVRPKTGAVVWRVKEASGGCTPAIGDGYIVFAAAQGGFLCGRIGPNGFTKVWHNADYGGSGAMASIGLIHKGWFFAEVHTAGGREKMPPNTTELAIGIELATGKVVGPVGFAGVSQTLCTSPVAMDGRWFFHVGAGYSGMVMMDTDPANFRQVGLRMPTVKSWMPLPGGSKTKEKLDYCLTSTPAMAGGLMFFRGSDSLYCYDVRRPTEKELALMRQARQREAELLVRNFRAGKVDAATTVQELVWTDCRKMAETLLVEDMQKALNAADAETFAVLAASSIPLGRSASALLGPIVNEALASGKSNMALAAMAATNVLAGAEAKRAKPVLEKFLQGRDTALWGPASVMLRSIDDGADIRTVREMSRFSKSDAAAAVLASVNVVGSVATRTQEKSVRRMIVDHLTKLLEHKDLACQRSTISVLAGLGPDAKAAVNKLEELVILLPDLAKDVEQALEKIDPARKELPNAGIDLPDLDL